MPALQVDFKLASDVSQQALKAIQAVLHRCQALCNIFHKSPLSVDLPLIMGGRHDPLYVCGSAWLVVAGAYSLTVDNEALTYNRIHRLLSMRPVA